MNNVGHIIWPAKLWGQIKLMLKSQNWIIQRAKFYNIKKLLKIHTKIQNYQLSIVSVSSLYITVLVGMRSSLLCVQKPEDVECVLLTLLSCRDTRRECIRSGNGKWRRAARYVWARRCWPTATGRGDMMVFNPIDFACLLQLIAN